MTHSRNNRFNPTQLATLGTLRMSAREIVPVAQCQHPFFLGVDVGGTNIKIGLVDDLGQTIARASIATLVKDGPDAAVERIGQACDNLLAEAGLKKQDIARLGLGTPGMMDIPAGLLLDPPNLVGWENYPIRDRVAGATGLPVTFANDANAAAFGESWVGSGRNFPSIVLLTLGTGVGGGIIIGDLSIDGENSHGSECGHIIIDSHDDARMCGCGRRGHLEAYASATALIKRAEEALEHGRTSSLSRRVAAGEQITPLMIGAEAEAGDPLSLELIMDTARFLGIGITILAHIIDPGAIILGGAMNFGGHERPLGYQFLDRVRHEFRARAFSVLAERTTIDYATLGGDAGYIGAAGIARAAYRRELKK